MKAGEPLSVADVLKQLAHEQTLTPELVVQHAKDAKSPLHAYFEWNDATAGHAYRLEQARSLIRSVDYRVVIEERVVNIPYFTRDPSLPSGQQGYTTIDRLKKDPQDASKHVEAELKSVIEHLNRAEGYAVVLKVQEGIRKVKEQVRRLSARVHGQPLQ